MKRKPNTSAGDSIRLQVYLARAGVSSRRGGERLILDGRVAVNGKTVREMGSRVHPGVDRVAVDGREVVPESIVWIAVHKPQGHVTTRGDTHGRRTVYDLLPAKYHHLFHVGRLDLNSEGLLLLTNDGPGANRLLHPRYGVTKEYRAEVEGGRPGREVLRRLEAGVELEDGVARAERAWTDGDDLLLVLREGRKREVRRMLVAVGHPVRRLVRERFGALELRGLELGAWRVLNEREVDALLA